MRANICNPFNLACILGFTFNSGLHRSPVFTSICQQPCLIISICYSRTSSLCTSPRPYQPEHPWPLQTDKRPSTSLRGVRILRHKGRPSVRRTSTAAPGCNLQVVLPATYPCLLTSLSFYETPCHCSRFWFLILTIVMYQFLRSFWENTFLGYAWRFILFLMIQLTY